MTSIRKFDIWNTPQRKRVPACDVRIAVNKSHNKPTRIRVTFYNYGKEIVKDWAFIAPSDVSKVPETIYFAKVEHGDNMDGYAVIKGKTGSVGFTYGVDDEQMARIESSWLGQYKLKKLQSEDDVYFINKSEKF